MGYNTDFSGRFNLDKPLTDAQRDYLYAFSKTRRMRWDGQALTDVSDPLREAVALPIGVEGAFYVGHKDATPISDGVSDYNWPPNGQPGLWCQWVPTDDGAGIEWDGNEKFYNYAEWLEYIIKHFLKPWGVTVNGRVDFKGEAFYDIGSIVVKSNYVNVVKSKHDNESVSGVI